MNNILIRASALGKIMTEPKTAAAKASGELGETAKTYLKELYRELYYQRRKEVKSKYLEKGICMEEDCLTLLSRVRGVYLKKNTVRLNNEYLTGEPDAFIGSSIQKAEEGFDTKAAWSLFTLPFEDDGIDKDYYWQNVAYMALTGAKAWTTAHCLVNAPAHLILAEKNKVYYEMGCPDDTNLAFVEKKIEIEKNMIFDMAQFRKDNPHFDIDCNDWRYDIPMAERVVQFRVERNEDEIKRAYAQVEKARNYMKKQFPNLLIEHDTEVDALIVSEA